MTTPKLPPPPRSAQNRSGCWSALARSTWPAAVTTWAERRLSHDSPYWLVSQPNPPPRVSPPTPVWLTVPAGTARPCAWVAASSWASVAPPPARAVRVPGSTVTWLMALRSMVRPSSPTAAPAKLCAPPRTEISRPASCANRTAAATSPGPAQRAITAGWASMAPFHTERAWS